MSKMTAATSLTESVHFKTRLDGLQLEHDALVGLKNEPILPGNGVFERYRHPVLTADHVPLEWRYDLNPGSNPFLMERMPVAGVSNPGAVFQEGRFMLVARVEGGDRKSFFAVAESSSGIDGFRFRSRPVVMPETDDPDVDVSDMRITRHEDGWIYGLFTVERRDSNVPVGDPSAPTFRVGVARTHDLETWERLPDLKSSAPQQRHVALHPEFVDGRYALYTDSRVGGGAPGRGIGWALCDTMNGAEIGEESIIDEPVFRAVTEAGNGLGPAPLWTDYGWLHLAHGVRRTASGLRSVLYVFLMALDEPRRVLYRPAGQFLGPVGSERLGDVSNTVFSNGWIARSDGKVFLYYGSGDTRCHVAVTSVERLLDHVMQSPPDGGRSAANVRSRILLIERNEELL